MIYGSKGYNAFGAMGQPGTSAPFRDAAIASPTPSATFILSHAAPLGVSLGFLRNESTAQLLFGQGALTRSVTFLSSCPLTRLAKSPVLPRVHDTWLQHPAGWSYTSVVSGSLQKVGPHYGRGDVPFSPVPLLPLTRHAALLPSCPPGRLPRPSPPAAAVGRSGHGAQPRQPPPSSTARRAPFSVPPSRSGCGPQARSKAGEPPGGGGGGPAADPQLPAQLSALPSRRPPPRSAAGGRARRRAAPAKPGVSAWRGWRRRRANPAGAAGGEGCEQSRGGTKEPRLCGRASRGGPAALLAAAGAVCAATRRGALQGGFVVFFSFGFFWVLFFGFFFVCLGGG